VIPQSASGQSGLKSYLGSSRCRDHRRHWPSGDFSFVFSGDGEFDAEAVIIKRPNLELAG
jgi:hypothetical protein